MPRPNDPSWHQQREAELIRHVTRLLDERDFVIDTSEGRRSAASMKKSIKQTDQSVAVHRRMIELNVPDHELKSKLPTGASLEAVFSKSKWWVFEKTLAQVVVMSLPPTDDLLSNRSPEPIGAAQVRSALGKLPPSLSDTPATVILLSSSGFSREAQLLVDRTAERSVILVEPNESGGWSVYGPVETKGVLDLLDPEDDESKARRLREAVESASLELASGGIAADKLAARLTLPLDVVEKELKTIARERGLMAKRLDGRVVLYRELAKSVGSNSMPIIDRLKGLFGAGGSVERKIAFLSERRAQIAVQRDKTQEELSALETHELDLREQFKKTQSTVIRKRLTTQLVQLQADLQRKSQLMQMLNQQANVVSSHLHSLELIQQGQSIKLPDSESMAEDAAKAEEILAQLQADSELAGELSSASTAGMSDAEQAMYEELLKEAGETTTSATQEPVRSTARSTDEPTATRADPVAAPAGDPPEKRATPSAG